MDSEQLTRGLLYLSLAIVGIPGNLAVIYAFLMALHYERHLLTADAIVLHLAMVNLQVVTVRCVFESFATFQIVNVFDDTGCKGIIFVYRTARSLSIWLTFVLSAYQSLNIAPPGSHWATAREVFARFLWLIFLFLWIINLLMSTPSIAFSMGTKNNSNIFQNSIIVQFCFVKFPSASLKEGNGVMQMTRDVVPMTLMTTASLIILVFLYKHSRRVRGIRGGGGGGGGGGSSERRAAITVISLVMLYVVLYGVDNGLWVYTLLVQQTMSSALISDLRIFFTCLYAALSPIIIIVSNRKVNKHLRCGSEEKATG